MGLFPGDNLHRTCAAVLIALVSLMFSSCEFFRTLFLGPLYGITLEVETGGNCSVEPAAEKEENGVFYFRDGTTVTMTAAPSAGYRFTGWVVDAQRSYSKILTIPALGRDTGVTLEFSPVETAWTILVYLDGDNDLEGNAITDFEEMETGLYLAQTGDPGVMDKVAVAVQFDRGNEISSSFDGVWTTARRYEVLPDYSAGCGSRLVEDLGEVNMGDPATLKDFLEWGKCTFPAEYYVLVLWNHGGGARDLTPDDGRRDICSMKPREATYSTWERLPTDCPGNTLSTSWEWTPASWEHWRRPTNIVPGPAVSEPTTWSPPRRKRGKRLGV